MYRVHRTQPGLVYLSISAMFRRGGTYRDKDESHVTNERAATYKAMVMVAGVTTGLAVQFDSFQAAAEVVHLLRLV